MYFAAERSSVTLAETFVCSIVRIVAKDLFVLSPLCGNLIPVVESR